MQSINDTYSIDDMSQAVQAPLIELQAMLTAAKRLATIYTDGPNVTRLEMERHLSSIEQIMAHAQNALDAAWKATDPIQEINV